jgi:hypothetical protein
MVKKRKELVAVFVMAFVMFAGYTVGKDAALRDNRSFGPYDNSKR